MKPQTKETATAYTLGAVGAAIGVWQHFIRPELTAKRGWSAIGVGVLAYEMACPAGELLSEGVDRAIERYPLAVPLGIGYTALHLMNLLPEPVDFFHRVLR